MDRQTESIPAQKDTTAQEDKMKSIQEGKMSVPVDAYQTKEAEQEQKRKEKALRENIIEALGSPLEMINKQEEDIKGLREENKRLNARLAEKPIKEAYSNTTPQTAQPAPEARDVIRICVCPHCGKADIIVSPAGRIYCNCYKKGNPNPQFEAAWDMLNMLIKAGATNR